MHKKKSAPLIRCFFSCYREKKSGRENASRQKVIPKRMPTSSSLCCYFLQSSVLLSASVHICLLVWAGEEVFIISACPGSGIEFLHLCPRWLSPGPLNDTLYLLNFTSLTLSTCNTSTYLSPSLPPLLPPFLLPSQRDTPPDAWLLWSRPASDCFLYISWNVLLLLTHSCAILCFPLISRSCFPILSLFSLLSSFALSCHHHFPLTIILIALHTSPFFPPPSLSIKPASIPPVILGAFVVTQIGFFWRCSGRLFIEWQSEMEREREGCDNLGGYVMIERLA